MILARGNPVYMGGFNSPAGAPIRSGSTPIEPQRMPILNGPIGTAVPAPRAGQTPMGAQRLPVTGRGGLLPY